MVISPSYVYVGVVCSLLQREIQRARTSQPRSPRRPALMCCACTVQLYRVIPHDCVTVEEGALLACALDSRPGAKKAPTKSVNKTCLAPWPWLYERYVFVPSRVRAGEIPARAPHPLTCCEEMQGATTVRPSACSEVPPPNVPLRPRHRHGHWPSRAFKAWIRPQPLRPSGAARTARAERRGWPHRSSSW